MSNIYVKKATLHDLPHIMAIIEAARALLKADGSPQWQDGSPSVATFEQDIKNENCWLLMVDRKIAGTATLLTAPDPNYAEILDGAWNNNHDPYISIHRIAISADFRGLSLSKFFFSNLITLGIQADFNNFRIDTHAINIRMQKIVHHLGFVDTGIIYVNPTEDGRRLAFELNI